MSAVLKSVEGNDSLPAIQLVSESHAMSLPDRANVALSTVHQRAQLTALVLRSSSIVTVTNLDGRTECHTAYMLLKNTRLNITKAVEVASEDVKAFLQAIKTEEKERLAIMSSEEARLKVLRDDFDELVENERLEALAKEQARTAALEQAVADLRNLPLTVAGKSSIAITVALNALRDTVIDKDSFDDYVDLAGFAKHDSITRLQEMFDAADAAETLAAKVVEDARLENLRMEALKLELETQRLAQAETARLQAIADADREAKIKADQEELASLRAQLEKDKAALIAAQTPAPTPEPEPKPEPAAAVEIQAEVEVEATNTTAAPGDEYNTNTEADYETEMRTAVSGVVDLFDAAEQSPRPSLDELLVCVADQFEVTSAVAHEWLTHYFSTTEA